MSTLQLIQLAVKTLTAFGLLWDFVQTDFCSFHVTEKDLCGKPHTCAAAVYLQEKKLLSIE